MAIPLAARITGQNDRLEIADAFVESLSFSSAGFPFLKEVESFSMALLAVQRDDAIKAREHYGVLPQSDTHVASFFMIFDRLLGLLAQTMEEPSTAATHFEDSLVLCRKAGYRPELAWTCCDYAYTLRDRNAEGDRAKAISLLDESLAISSELGMRPLMERVLSRREILKA